MLEFILFVFFLIAFICRFIWVAALILVPVALVVLVIMAIVNAFRD